MCFYIQIKPEHIRQGKNSLLFSVSQTHRRRFAKSKTAAGRTPTESRKSARQKAGTHPANCYNKYKLTNKTRAAQPLSRHSALTRAAGFLPILRIVPPLVFALGMALIPPTLHHLQSLIFLQYSEKKPPEKTGVNLFLLFFNISVKPRFLGVFKALYFVSILARLQGVSVYNEKTFFCLFW